VSALAWAALRSACQRLYLYGANLA